ncbi:DUF3136 domain-containing protein [Cyanobium sp. HWJ4-Hawea]|uniref:DUF3136 domain-containing protein n=1 Tax=unclassified Cyanobium TaxID=2627006 RepID=UPI0020CC118B|nr:MULTISPECIES: DUF3136 domain-containing protein [unclassified Cyanobium]MCP9774301.1 DUF3136 domain-containing protein [Cyanobium sp. WAJ14-Wanaka]MCP9808723.1 DUF3136 domain-containing protein [Cyanobium sp. HWJ4-Hawea]
MTIATTASTLTIGELEASYPLYCKALRILIREGKTINKVRRTVCWQRLEVLHNCLPNQYREPDYLFVLLSREVKEVIAKSLQKSLA